jgi:hypothetical protein
VNELESDRERSGFSAACGKISISAGIHAGIIMGYTSFGLRGNRFMMTCIERAEHCERMALLVQEPEQRLRFVELARLWRGMVALADVSAQAGGRPDRKREEAWRPREDSNLRPSA